MAGTSSALLVALALMAVPAGAVTKTVRFSFTAGGTAASGSMALDCLSGGGNCTITALSGSFGGQAMTLNPPPPPPPAPPTVKPDNEVTQPGYRPSGPGLSFEAGDWGFWLNGPTLHEFPPGDWRHGKSWEALTRYESDYEPVGPTFDITDYEAAVPEPASWALLLLGFGLTGAALRRRMAHGAGARQG